jgi:hypothetical protein
MSWRYLPKRKSIRMTLKLCWEQARDLMTVLRLQILFQRKDSTKIKLLQSNSMNSSKVMLLQITKCFKVRRGYLIISTFRSKRNNNSSWRKSKALDSESWSVWLSKSSALNQKGRSQNLTILNVFHCSYHLRWNHYFVDNWRSLW